jgi:CheY-like chemotaxis protein
MLPLRVLIVDDDRDTADTTAFLLRHAGHDARAAYDAAAALDLVAGWPPEVAVLDLQMPRTDGFVLAERLCAELQVRPLLVAVSASIRKAGLDRVRAAFDHHFLKPVEPGALIDLLRGHAAKVGGSG